MISIIVPVYKVEKYIRKCIESILNQTYKHFELILVDDGSPDNSGAICDEYAEMDSRVKVLHQENAGQASARNAGLEIAKGDYISFVDSDDTIETNMLEILAEMLEIHGCDIAMCGHRIVRENEETKLSVQEYKVELMDIEALWNEIFGSLNNAVWNKLFKRDLLDDIRFPLDLVHGEDLIFNLEYLIKCKMGAINRTPCYNYLKRNDSVTTSSFSNKKLMEIVSKDRALDIVSKYRTTQIANAQKFCFRSRMNVVRAIAKAGVEEQYLSVVDECRAYVKECYADVKHNLKRKERLEYHLSTKNFYIYKIIIHKFW